MMLHQYPAQGARTEEDAAMPVFSDPMREAKHSPTHSNFSAPENLQGAPLPHTPVHSWPCQAMSINCCDWLRDSGVEGVLLRHRC